MSTMANDLVVDPVLRRIVAILNIALVPLVLPVYAMILWMFATNSNFKTLSYKLMLFSGIFDVFYNFSMGQAGLMSCQRSVFFEAFHMFGGAIQISYLSLAPVLSFLLGLHRLFIIWRIRFVKVIVFKILIALTCICAVLLPLGALLVRMQFGYDVGKSATYYYDGKTLYAKLTINTGFTFLCATLICYFFIAIGLAYQKWRYAHTVNHISTQEIYLVMQAFLLFAPFATTRIIVYSFVSEIFGIPAVHAGFMIASSLIPAVNLIVHIASNSQIRKALGDLARPRFRIIPLSGFLSIFT